MKLAKHFLLCVVILVYSLDLAAAEPLAKFSVRSYEDLTNAIALFAANLNPNSPKDYVQEFSQALGLTNSAAFDVRRPWEIAVWYEGGTNQPLVAAKAPVTSIPRFKETAGATVTNIYRARFGGSARTERLLQSLGREWIPLDNGSAMILFRDAETLTKTEQSALDQWKAEAIRQPARRVELTIRLSEPLRRQLMSLMAIAKLSLVPALSSGNSLAAPGLNPKAINEVFGAYFELLDTFLSGFQEVKLGLDLNSEALIVDKRITAKPGTELAQWLQKPAGRITAQDLNGMDPEAFFSAVGYMGKEPGLLRLVKKFTLLGFQVQSMETNDVIAQEIDSLIDQMLPMSFAASVYLKDQYGFAAVYRFPASDAAAVYPQLKRFITHSLQTQVGEGKMYSSITLQEKYQVLNGLPVDRLSLTINTNSPLFNMPGQREQLQTLWPNGKMEIDYAIKDGQMLMASGDRMKSLLGAGHSKLNGKSAFSLDESTCLAGCLNGLQIVKQVVAANPILPGAIKEKLARTDPQGTGIEFQISLDQQMRAETRIPLRLFRELGRLQDK